MPRNHGNKQNTCVLMLVLGIYSVADFVVASVGLRHRSDKVSVLLLLDLPGHPLPDLGKQHQHLLFQFLLSFSHLRMLENFILARFSIRGFLVLCFWGQGSSIRVVKLQ